MVDEGRVITCPPPTTCQCCECRGKMCLIPHPGHSCGRPKRRTVEDEWDAMKDPWLTAFMEWEDRS